MHIKTHQGSQCNLCEKEFTTRKAMLDHRSHVHSNLIDKYCRFCKHTFSVKHSLIEHMTRVHGSDDINKAYCRMENGDSILLL